MKRLFGALASLMIVLLALTGCHSGGMSGGAAFYQPVAFELRDQVTGEPIPNATLNIYSISVGGEAPLGDITQTNIYGVAQTRISSNHPVVVEVYRDGYYMIPQHIENPFLDNVSGQWFNCGYSMDNGRKMQIRILTEAMVAARAKELPNYDKPIVVDGVELDNEIERRLEKAPPVEKADEVEVEAPSEVVPELPLDTDVPGDADAGKGDTADKEVAKEEMPKDETEGDAAADESIADETPKTDADTSTVEQDAADMAGDDEKPAIEDEAKPEEKPEAKPKKEPIPEVDWLNSPYD